MAEPTVRLSWRQRYLGPSIAGGVAAAVWFLSSEARAPGLGGIAAIGGLAAGSLADVVLRAFRRGSPVTVLGMFTWALIAPVAVYPVALGITFISQTPRLEGPCDGLSVLVLGGIVGGLWGLTWRLLVVGNHAHRALIALSIAIAALLSGAPAAYMEFGRTRARAVSCQSNLRSVRQALLLYAEDYDGRLPPPVSPLDLAGVHYERFEEARRQPIAFGMAVLGDGLLWPYTKNASIWHCPADPTWRDCWGRPRTDYLPEPGLSYHWNVELAQTNVDDIQDPAGTPVIFDRRAFHRGRRNVAFVDGHVGDVGRTEWRPVESR